jgi:hypothetical protein
MWKVLLISLALGSFACSHYSTRVPASISDESDLLAIIDSLAREVEAPVSSTTHCSEGLELYYKKMLNMTSSSININALKGDSIDQVINRSFEARLMIKEKLKQLDLKTDVDARCLVAVQDVLRALRYVEDYMIEMKVVKEQGQTDKESFMSLEGEAPYFLVNPKFSDFKGPEDLKSGDLILSRGNAHSSAAIARIGTVDQQFSHLSFVYRDDKGELYTIEAHIEVGSIAEPLQEHLDSHNAREVVFRFNDAEMAHQAAKIMYEKVRTRQDKRDNIQYDFSMDYKNNDRIFCSEMIYDGFKLASDGKLNIPLYKTKFGVGMIPFLNGIGVKVTKENIDQFDTFSPADIEFDPRFEMVAEWRNPAKMSDIRIKDAILTKLFEWMEKENYEFHPSVGMNLSSRAAWMARRLPIVKKKLTEKFPLNMKSSQLRLFMVLDDVAEPVYEYVTKLEKDRSHPFSPVELYQAIEALKVADAKAYQTNPKAKPVFHKLFRPKTMKKARSPSRPMGPPHRR